MMMRRYFIPLLSCVLVQAAAAEVVARKWSGTLNVPDPVACTVDEYGRVYVAATTRRKAADLDIREHPMWIADDVGLTTVEEKREFLKRELAPGRLRLPRGGLKDHNKDGSIDWQDLTVHSERVYQLRDTNGDGLADKMTVFAEGFNTEVTGIAAGILYHDGWVYLTCAPDLWRLKDTDDDGVADVREVVAHGFGMHIAYAGHDMHGPRLGPDGRIYWSIGDKGVSVTSKEGKKFHLPHEGAVLRVEPDGAGFEVFARGLRNVQEIAFDDFGNMFGVDNDADLPGERERLVYITDQSDSGWRCGHQYMKGASRWILEDVWLPQQPWKGGGSKQPLFITPPLANYSDGPAGFLHEPGTALGASLRGHFLLNQFPSGRMDAFKLEPDGAAFKMTDPRTIHNGVMGIGMAWGVEGALYFADWDGGYPLDEKGGIWTLDSAADKDAAARRETMEIIATGFGSRPDSDLQKLLGHADRRVRMSAQLELAKRGQWDALLAIAADTGAPLLARVHAIWGAGIGLRHGKVPETLLHERLAAETDAEIQTQLVKIIGDAKPSVAATRAVDRMMTSESPRVRLHAALALGRMAPVSAGLSLAKVELNNAAFYLLDRVERDAHDPFLRHALVSGLAGCMSAEDLASRFDSESEPVRLVCALALARQRSPLIKDYLKDSSDAVFDEVCRAIHDDGGIPDVLPELAALLDGGRPLTPPARRRAINANLRMGQPVNAARLLQHALNQPPEQAVEALRTLLVFSKPPRLDLVDGMAGTYPRMDENALSPSLIETWKSDLLALKDPSLKTAVVELLIQLQLEVDASVLLAIAVDEKAETTLRIGALRLMTAKNPQAPAVAQALEKTSGKTAPEELRMESLALTARHQPERALGEISRVLDSGTLREKQAAISLLAAHPGSGADALMTAWLQKLADEKVETGLRLDVIEAAQGRESVAARVTAWQQTRKTPPAEDLIEGGDIKAGREIVNNHIGANCVACHTVEAKEGSQVGPPLKGIGTLRARAELLESLVNPVAQIAEGYGLVSLTLKDGGSHAGSLVSESDKAVRLRLPDGALKEIPREIILAQTPPVSVMPPMLGILTPREVRDVVAYLASLTGAPDKKPQPAKTAPKAVVKTAPAPAKKAPASTPAKSTPGAPKAAVKAAPEIAPPSVPQPAPAAPAPASSMPVELADIPRAIPVDDNGQVMTEPPKQEPRKGGITLRFGNRKKEEAPPPPLVMPEPMSADDAGETKAEDKGENKPPAPAPAKEAAKETAKAGAKSEPAAPAPKAEAPAKADAKDAAAKSDAPPPAEMPAEAKTEEKKGFFSRFRSKKNEEE
ncbi:MAG TPA: c-type cytochrome [Prosthecobacter sp.]|nr:c-type cytochrome [Prosthecobacter sp.]HRK15138.1 c-type cytochrome [Prosthecobacter sp.]